MDIYFISDKTVSEEEMRIQGTKEMQKVTLTPHRQSSSCNLNACLKISPQSKYHLGKGVNLALFLVELCA